jgi:Uncharacterized protein conserved in bacteria (DUF2325)
MEFTKMEGLRETTLASMKNVMREMAEELSFDNYKAIEHDIKNIFIIMDATDGITYGRRNKEEGKYIPAIREETIEEAEKSKAIAKMAEELADQDIVEEPSKEESMEELLKEEESKVYRFERRIKAGVIPELGAYVPEIIIQDLGLEHGDLVTAKFLEKGIGKPDQYEFSLVKKAEEITHPEGIQEVNLGIIEYIPRFGAFGISKTAGGGQLYNEYNEELTLQIADEDLDRFTLHEGDIVDAAYYIDNPSYVRIRWVHNFDETDKAEKTEKPKPSSYYKKTDKDDEKEEVKQIFKGKTICALGFEPFWYKMKEEVESRGGQLLTLTGKEPNFSTIAGNLSKSDCVVIFAHHVSHSGKGGSPKTVEYCKRYNIPFDAMHSFGRSSFVKKVSELLGISQTA